MKLAVLLLCASAFAAEAEKEEGTPFKFKASGWGVVENETLENFGDGVANNFDKNDPNNSTSDTNLLLNLNFEATKDNLKLTATCYGIKPEENETIVLMWMIRFGLWNFRNHKWNELSSGYKMRFELARTFLRNPKVLFLDEPLANLDILSQQLIIEDLKLLGKSLSNPLGIILSSQQLYEVEKVSDEIIFLKNGLPSSFNNLKNEKNNQQQQLVVEIEIENDRNELLNALEGIKYKELKFLGNNYYIEIEGIRAEDFLKQLLNKHIQIKYFRDISVSTRRFFNQ